MVIYLNVKTIVTFAIIFLLLLTSALFIHVNASKMAVKVEVAPSPEYPEPISDLSQAVEDQTPWLNKIKDYEKLETRSPPSKSPNPDDGWFGTKIKQTTGVIGVYASQEIQAGLELGAPPIGSPPRILYAPTLTCPNGCPLESVTSYSRQWWEPATSKTWRIYDFASDSWVYTIHFKDFMIYYVCSYPEGELYFTEVIKESGTWYVLLYNFYTGKWEKKYSQSSDFDDRTHGWDIWEFKNWDSNWPLSFPRIESLNLKVYDGVTWYDVDQTYGEHWRSTVFPYSWGWITPYSHWWVQ